MTGQLRPPARIVSYDRYTMDMKMEKLRQLNAAIDRLLLSWEKDDPSYRDHHEAFDALELQNLRNQRQSLMATFPPIRLVVDNT